MAIDYQKKTWAYGNEVEPDDLNHWENGIKSACDAADRMEGLTLKGNAAAITSYPNKAGVYTVQSKFTGIPDAATQYGNLVIMGGGYYTHIYHDSSNNMYVGRTSGSVSAPSSWKKITMS